MKNGEKSNATNKSRKSNEIIQILKNFRPIFKIWNNYIQFS